MKKSHFSILSAIIRPEIQERIAVGLLLVDNSEVFFAFSKSKLHVLKELLPANNYSYFKELLNKVNHKVSGNNIVNNIFLGVEEEVKKPFSISYLDYVSRYSNNILHFSSPKIIELEANSSLYDSLFRKYIDDSLNSDVLKLNRFDSLKASFYPKIKPYFNINKVVSDKDIPNLILPLKVDMIGRNSIPVFAQVIDLERHIYHIKNDLGVVSLLNESFGNSHSFIITEEPNKDLFPKQHDIWSNLKGWKDAEAVDVSEVQKVQEYAEQHGVTPFN